MLFSSGLNIEIDYNALTTNLAVLKDLVGSLDKVIGVVKSNAYGHGILEISNYLIAKGVKILAVNSLEEGIYLRENGICVDILILGYTSPCHTGLLVRFKLIQSVFSYDMAIQIAEYAKKYNYKIPIHIKIDTGMSRLGIENDLMAFNYIKQLYLIEKLNVCGIFTHLTSSNAAKGFEITCRQFNEFNYLINRLQKEGYEIPVKHICNSSGVLNYFNINPNGFFVRPGSLLYGLNDPQLLNIKGKKVRTRPVMTIKSTIVSLKTIDRGSPIGYNESFVSDSKRLIAVVPIGFANGYPKMLSNRGKVIINRQFAPVVGSVCMNQMTVDVTEIDNIRIGDEVIIIGADGNIEITIKHISQYLGTAVTELSCTFGNLSVNKNKYTLMKV